MIKGVSLSLLFLFLATMEISYIQKKFLDKNVLRIQRKYIADVLHKTKHNAHLDLFMIRL